MDDVSELQCHHSPCLVLINKTDQPLRKRTPWDTCNLACNLGQYKMEQLSPIPPPSPQSNDEGAKEQEARHFGIIQMGGGVVQMSH